MFCFRDLSVGLVYGFIMLAIRTLVGSLFFRKVKSESLPVLFSFVSVAYHNLSISCSDT